MAHTPPHSYVPPEKSLGFMTPEHWLRRWCIQLVKQKAFEWTVFVIVLLSCLLLAMDQPDVKVRSLTTLLVVFAYSYWRSVTCY